MKEKLKKNYRFHNEMDNTKLLWDFLQERDIVIEGYVYLRVWSSGDYMQYNLHSEIGNDDIYLTSKPGRKFTLKKYEDLEWIFEKGLYLSKKHN